MVCRSRVAARPLEALGEDSWERAVRARLPARELGQRCGTRSTGMGDHAERAAHARIPSTEHWLIERSQDAAAVAVMTVAAGGCT